MKPYSGCIRLIASLMTSKRRRPRLLLLLLLLRLYTNSFLEFDVCWKNAVNYANRRQKRLPNKKPRYKRWEEFSSALLLFVVFRMTVALNAYRVYINKSKGWRKFSVFGVCNEARICQPRIEFPRAPSVCHSQLVRASVVRYDVNL